MRWPVWVQALVVALLLVPVPGALAQDTPTEPAPFTRAEIRRAVEQVRNDPHLAAERTIRMPAWSSSPPREPSGLLTWVRDLFGFLAESARVLVWVAAAIVAALLLVRLLQIIQGAARTGDAATFVAPTHVRDLDIRPESLPPDIGAVARDLWDRGEHRRALALLYRGLLSRLAHVHRVPIRDSTTEGDCITLAAGHLPLEPSRYARRLVDGWRLAVYAGRSIDTSTVHALCTEFSAALDAPHAPRISTLQATAEGQG